MSRVEAAWIQPTELRRLTGTERFNGLDATVGDFWGWAFNDLRDNTTRGVLAEFFVARALGDVSERRVAWANYDVLTRTGVRVEVKSSGRLQSWSQPRPSAPVFGRITGRAWDPETNEWSTTRVIRADVFVFALQTCSDPTAYDVVDLAQWEFMVASASRLAPLATRSISLATLHRIGCPSISFAELSRAVEDAHHENVPGELD